MRNWYFKVYRSPKTQSDRRQNVGPYIRPKRRSKNIITGWNDIPRSFQRTWKKFRKTQWKSKGK